MKRTMRRFDSVNAPLSEMPQRAVEWAGCFVTDPVHGGKVTCHKCNGFIQEKDVYLYNGHGYNEPFHKDCYNQYEHYYGLDKPID